MTRTELRRLRRTLATLTAPQPFCYCVQARDGLPALLVAPRLDAGELLALQRTARVSLFVRGLASREGGQLVFAVTSGDPSLLEQDLAASFAAQLPLDAAAVVRPPA